MRRSLVALALLAFSSTAFAQSDATAPHDDEADGDGHDHGGAMRAPPQNAAQESPAMPPGSIELTTLDPDGKPLANVPVTLGIVESSVAKGESRRRELAVSGPDGKVRWNQQQTGMGIAYRLTVVKDGATFAVTPFQLGPERGIEAKLYVFPVVRSVQDAVILSKGATYVEFKDDRVQIEQMFTIANFGKTAWVPDNFTMAVPHGLQAFVSEQGMSDVALDKVDKQDLLRLRGTFAPGQQQLVIRWQLPYAGERDVSIDADAPPNMAQARVLAAAAQKMRLEVEGMGQGKLDELQGQRVLAVDWDQLSARAPMRSFKIRLHDIPESGLPSWLIRSGVALAALVSISAIAMVRSGKKHGDAAAKQDTRTHLLEELAELERAHQAGDVGPKTYERARRELVDRIALTLAA